MAPSSTATSGKTSWMLKTNGTPQRLAAALGAARLPPPPRLEAGMDVQGRRGHAVQRVPPPRQLGGDAGHHLARRGQVGGEVRTEDEDVHGTFPASASRYTWIVWEAVAFQEKSSARARPSSTSRVRAASSANSSSMASVQASGSSGLSSRAAPPMTSGSAVVSA